MQFVLPDDRRTQDIVAVLMSLPSGKVVSYGEVASDAGYPKQARFVGHILAKYAEELDLAWWMEVNAQGRLVPGLEVEQRRLLLAEGVMVSNGRARRTTENS